MGGKLGIRTFFTLCFLTFSFHVSEVFAQTREDAEKWLKTTKDILALVEKTAGQLVQGEIENIAQKDPAVKEEWESAKEWLSLAKEELKKAEDLCAKGKWAECSHSAKLGLATSCKMCNTSYQCRQSRWLKINQDTSQNKAGPGGMKMKHLGTCSYINTFLLLLTFSNRRRRKKKKG